MRLPFKNFIKIFLFLIFLSGLSNSFAESLEEATTIDRIQLVTQQINLLKDRQAQGARELEELQLQHDRSFSQLQPDKISKNILDKISLDISVARSNLDSINIELADCQQTITWLEKSVQEIQNQLNVFSIFGIKAASEEVANASELHNDLDYQKKLLKLEKSRIKYLQDLQSMTTNILALKREHYGHLSRLLSSRSLLHIKQQQAKDELAYQEQQNQWLRELNELYTRIAKVDPAQSKGAYTALERQIFYANEKANFAYTQSLIARYQDQIQQMKLAVLKSNSISLLNEIGDQVQILTKQINRLSAVLKVRMDVLNNHITYLTKKKKDDEAFQEYLSDLRVLVDEYVAANKKLAGISENLNAFRHTWDKALQNELSSRQGFPVFGQKTLVDVGKEMLLVPALTFQIVKSLSNNLAKSFQSATAWTWVLLAFSQYLVIFSCLIGRKLLSYYLNKPSAWRDKINSKWLSLQWLRANFIDLALIADFACLMLAFGIPFQNFIVPFYLSLVWVVIKSIFVLARLCLVETTHDTTGHDMRLYRRLKWIILVGGMITGLTVFTHQLPLIYEIKTLCDRLFLMLLMVISILLLRSWDVLPNLILSHMESRHPYFEKSIRLIGLIIPLLMLGNSIIGIFGFVNLIMTVSWYEGIFLIVLIGYLVLRGLLSDSMEQLSRLVIQHVNNGWLLTEAFLKPLDKVLRITLFLVAWAVLFLLYGWDKQSPIVERLTRLLHYQLVNVLNTVITPLNIIELMLVISVFYWTAKWTREFVYRLLSSRTQDMGIRNSIAILSQYSVVVLGAFICLRVLGIDLRALAVVAGMFAFGVGLGLRDLANNFACGFLILLERPLRVGDIVNINGVEGEVTHIGSRAVTVKTWDFMELVVPNTEIFNKCFTNWTAKDTTVRTVVHVKISRYDNPHEVKLLIQNVLGHHEDVLKDPIPEVFLKDMSDILMEFELRYFVNIRKVKSRTKIVSSVLMKIWDEFALHGIKPPYPQHEIFLRSELGSEKSLELLDVPVKHPA